MKLERVDWKRRLVDMCGGKCMDCGWSGHLAAFDFDHREPKARPGDAIARMLKAAAWETIVAEIAKCDLVCANCHRIRTVNRRAPR